MKISNFDEQKHAYLIHTWSDKAFKGIAILCLEGHLKLRLHSVSALKTNYNQIGCQVLSMATEKSINCALLGHKCKK